MDERVRTPPEGPEDPQRRERLFDLTERRSEEQADDWRALCRMGQFLPSSLLGRSVISEQESLIPRERVARIPLWISHYTSAKPALMCVCACVCVLVCG
jgi:hypothetical protein